MIENPDQSSLRQSVIDELHAARDGAVLIHHSSAGKIRVTGADALDLLHRLSTNDLLQLKPNSSSSTVFVTDKGRIVDLAHVLVLPDHLLLLTTVGQESKLRSWIAKYTITEDIQLEIVSKEYVHYLIIGPEAPKFVNSAFSIVPKVNEIYEVNVEERTIILNRRNEFNVDTFDILCRSQDASVVHALLLQKGGYLRTMHQAGYQHSRITNGIPSEFELTDRFNPYEVNLQHLISPAKGCYIGQEVIARLDTYQKVQRRLVELVFDRFVPLLDGPVPLFQDSEEVGLLTSVVEIPHLDGFAALGVVRKDKVSTGDTLQVHRESFDAMGIVIRSFCSDPQ